MRNYLLFSSVVLLGALFVGTARADSYQLMVRNHQFTPLEVVVPAHQKLTLVVRNMDATEVDLDSSDLNQHNLVLRGNDVVNIDIGPLDPGHYSLQDQASKTGAVAVVVAQ